MILQRIFISHNFVLTQAKIQFKTLFLNLTNIFDQRQFFDPRLFSEPRQSFMDPQNPSHPHQSLTHTNHTKHAI